MFAIRAQGLTRAPLGRLPRPRSGGSTLSNIGGAMMSILRGGAGADAQAQGRTSLLEDVSFEIEQGTIVAFPGQDLKAIEAMMRIMSASLAPSGGQVEINGSIKGLLSVGENLDSEATARESVLRERSFLNVREDEEGESFLAEVLEFAGMKDFEDVMVRRYSTGMSLRLGLAMVLVARPDIVVIGDIMGVGDLDFHQRCKERIRKMADEGTTFLLAGPAFAVNDLADRVIFLERGRITRDALAGEEEEQDDSGPVTHNWHVTQEQMSSTAVNLASVDVLAPTPRRPATVIQLKWRIKRGPIEMWPIVDFLQDHMVIFRTIAPQPIKAEGPSWVKTSVRLPEHFLAAVPYHVRIVCDSSYGGRKRKMRVPHAIELVPTKPLSTGKGHLVPYLKPHFDWEIEPVGEAE